MTKRPSRKLLCPICQQQKDPGEMMHGEFVRGPVVELVQGQHPDWTTEHPICLTCLNRFRADYIQAVLETDRGELSQIEQSVIRSLKEQELLSQNVNQEFEQQLTFGERLADTVAAWGGSWRFLIVFGVVMACWIAVNCGLMIARPFDPYPFILLNLVLSCIAAIQAPVIMMSQNRQENKDRLRSEHDYRVNLKAELEIRHLNVKLDQLLTHQWGRLLEIQQIQLELMADLASRSKPPAP